MNVAKLSMFGTDRAFPAGELVEDMGKEAYRTLRTVAEETTYPRFKRPGKGRDGNIVSGVDLVCAGITA